MQERKLKKQLEEDIFQEILDEVVYGLCTKMGPRILQEAKKREAKEKEEAGQCVTYLMSDIVRDESKGRRRSEKGATTGS